MFFTPLCVGQLRLVVVLFQGVLHLSVDFINSFPLFAMALRICRPYRLAGKSHYFCKAETLACVNVFLFHFQRVWSSECCVRSRAPPSTCWWRWDFPVWRFVLDVSWCWRWSLFPDAAVPLQINPLKCSSVVQTYRTPTYSCYPRDSWVALVKKLFIGELIYPWRHKTTKSDWQQKLWSILSNLNDWLWTLIPSFLVHIFIFVHTYERCGTLLT